MEDNHNQDSMHWVMGGALLLIGAFVAIVLVMLNSQADTVGTNTNVGNISPTVVDVYMTTGADFTQSDNTGGNGGAIDLNAGGMRTLKITGTVEDLNGAADISTVTATFYHSAQAPSCTPDQNNCYRVPGCATSAGPTGDQLDFNCPINVAFWADSTQAGGPDATKDWIISIDVKDVDNTGGNNNSVHKEINTLLALNIPNTINFGSRSVNSTSDASTNIFQTIEQFGNDEADVEVSMSSPLGCTVRGAIPQGNVKWSLTDVPWGDGAASGLTGTANDTNLNVPYRSNDVTSQTRDLFWNIQVPSGVEGPCSSNMTTTAIAH